MRDPGKSKLKEHLLKDVPMTSNKKKVVDGAALLWSVDSERGEKFEQIFEKYTKNACQLEQLPLCLTEMPISQSLRSTANEGR